MLLIALIALLAVWGTVVVVVLGICVSAARSDRELLDQDLPAPARAGGAPALRLIAG
jgi:hypothetical protein